MQCRQHWFKIFVIILGTDDKQGGKYIFTIGHQTETIGISDLPNSRR